ncbi:MAG: hypothetical protein ACFB5Z_20695 [Elainellaceae cyanobacterium]
MTRTKPALPQRHLWATAMLCLIGLGILFRVANLGQAVYWVDEVATSMRVAGYTYGEVIQQVVRQPLTAADLLQFQRLRPNASWPGLLSVLAQSPEHAPLYFVLMRLWAERFGTSVAAMRSLSVVFSVMALPAMYWVCDSLFELKPSPNKRSVGWTSKRSVGWTSRRSLSSPVAWTATGLLAISPFFVAYAQEARPYSLWVLLLLLTLGTLWRSLQSNQPLAWVSYTLALILSLYTSLLTLLVVLGQGLAVVLFHPRRRVYLLATAAALIALLPWGWVVVTHWQVLQSNTVWMREPMPLWAILGIWHYSLAVLFFDVPVAAGQPALLGLQMAIATGVVALMGHATHQLARQTPTRLGWLLALGSLSTPAALLLIDLVRSGQAAATPRYLIPTQLGALIAVAYCLSRVLIWSRQRRGTPSRFWRCVAALLLSISLASCLIGLTHASNYQKSRNRSNPAIISVVNQSPSPLLIAEADHVQDLISLSYGLAPDVDIYIAPPRSPAADAAVNRPPDSLEGWLAATLRREADRLTPNSGPVFIFTPSETMKRAVQQNQGVLRPVYQPVRLISSELGLELWRLEFL